MKLQSVTSRMGTFTAKKLIAVPHKWDIVRTDDHSVIVGVMEGDCVTVNFQCMQVNELADLITLLLLIRVTKFFDLLETLKILDK